MLTNKEKLKYSMEAKVSKFGNDKPYWNDEVAWIEQYNDKMVPLMKQRNDAFVSLEMQLIEYRHDISLLKDKLWKAK